MQLNFSTLSAAERYHLMTQTIIPRPIAWVLTASNEKTEQDNYNLAPFSYFTGICSEPPLLMISITKKPDGQLKDTLINALKNKKMVIHIPSEKQAALVTQTAAPLLHGESEIKDCALTTTTLGDFELPRLVECDVAYGCELYETKEIGDAPQTLIFAEIKTIYINEQVLNTEKPERIDIKANKVKPLARLGGGQYTGITPPFK